MKERGNPQLIPEETRMKLKITNTDVLGFLLVFGMCIAINGHAQDTQNTPNRLKEAEKKFDLNGDGRLSDAEKEIMIEAITAEVFGGQDLNTQDLRDRQREQRFGGGGPGFGGRRGPRQQEKLLERFDADKNGKLNDAERKAARVFIQERRGEPSPSRPAKSTKRKDDLKASKAAKPKGNPDLYDDKTVRTLYLRFSDDDWYEQLGDFYRTDVNVPADLIVDGKVYKSVGVRFRGNSSYFTIQNSEKKSFDIAIDDDKNQRLFGYKTLNLLNGHVDASFLREVLYLKASRDYIPAPQANFVKLVINGENWGIYINSQQFNKDFLDDAFGTRKGVRWKVPAGRNGAGLVYNGADPADYRTAYQLKTNEKNAPNAWRDLMQLCEILDGTPDDQLEAALSKVLNIDSVLWYIALENAFIDGDGYISRGSDFNLYQAPDGRFYMIPHDSNETFRYAGGGGPNSWQTDGTMLSPLAQENDRMRPIINRLLGIPHWRSRYLAHLRTIAEVWLDWDRIAPIIEEYQALIDADVKADNKKLYAYEAFANSHTKDDSSGGFGGPPGGFGGGRGGGGGRGPRVTPSFKRFLTERQEYLLNHPDIDKPTPTIQSVSTPENPMANRPVKIRAEISSDVAADSVILHYATNRLGPFDRVLMAATNTAYFAEIPTFPAATKVYYYVEARAVESNGTTAFSPAKAELGALTYRVVLPVAENSPVVINELMANNTKSIADPQGDHDDWIELHNVSDAELDLTGMYLSDSRKNPRKWQFPQNTKLAPGGYLIVWADEDGKVQPGLHANFKLKTGGETVMLVDTDARGNQVLDSVKFGKQKKNVAFGRSPDGTGEFKPLAASPGQRNK
jgi:hypothetical protein